MSILTALALLTMMCWAIYLVVLQLRCIDTASEVARQAARGDRAAVHRAEQAAPQGARVAISSNRSTTTVTVRLVARPFAGWLVAVPLRARAQLDQEPSPQGPS